LGIDTFNLVALMILSCGAINWKGANNGGSTVKFGNKGNLATMKLSKALHDCKTQARPTVAAGQGLGLKSLEGFLLEFRINATPRVSNPNLDV
jgi:hypothetical protein